MEGLVKRYWIKAEGVDHTTEAFKDTFTNVNCLHSYAVFHGSLSIENLLTVDDAKGLAGKLDACDDFVEGWLSKRDNGVFAHFKHDEGEPDRFFPVPEDVYSQYIEKSIGETRYVDYEYKLGDDGHGNCRARIVFQVGLIEHPYAYARSILATVFFKSEKEMEDFRPIGLEMR